MSAYDLLWPDLQILPMHCTGVASSSLRTGRINATDEERQTHFVGESMLRECAQSHPRMLNHGQLMRDSFPVNNFFKHKLDVSFDDIQMRKEILLKAFYWCK